MILKDDTSTLPTDESIHGRSSRRGQFNPLPRNLPYSHRVKFVIRFVGYRDLDAFVDSSVRAG